MSVSHRMIFSLAPAVLAMIAGCAGGKNYSLGQEAERHGDIHQAYKYYCKAAGEYPDSATVVAAVKRVAPMAATYWESEALIAWSQGRHADAWRMAMRCLEVKPDHQGARQFVRKLEREHPQTIESAKRDWLAHGVAALAKAKPVSMELVSAAAGDAPMSESPSAQAVQSSSSPEPTLSPGSTESAPEAVAMATDQNPTPSDAARRDSPRLDPALGREPSRSDPEAVAETSDQAPTPSVATPQNSVRRDPTGSDSEAETAATASRQKPAPTPAATDGNESPSPPPSPPPVVHPADSKQKATPAQSASDPEKPAKPKPKPKRVRRRPRAEGAFLNITTLSKRDRRFKPKVRTLDSITIKLRDTDSEPDVDLDLYDGRRRTQKIRDLRTGRSKMFRGHSGKWYRLTILSIHHQTQTVRLGIGPA